MRWVCMRWCAAALSFAGWYRTSVLVLWFCGVKNMPLKVLFHPFHKLSCTFKVLVEHVRSLDGLRERASYSPGSLGS